MRVSRNLLLLTLLTAASVLIEGYHPGVEDDNVYLPAIKMQLHPQLYPSDSTFFRVQLQATIFDKLIAWSVSLTHAPLDWTVLFWHVGTIFLVLWGCWRISLRCFAEPHAQWAGVALVAALMSLPVAGTALFLMDQQLHPRALATAAILAAVTATLDGRRILSPALLVIALIIHPVMALLGISFCFFLALAPHLSDTTWLRKRTAKLHVHYFALLPLAWLFQKPPAAWQHALIGPNYLFLTRWQWYEWLGVLAPLAILWWFGGIARRNTWPVVVRLSRALIIFGVAQLLAAVAILSIPAMARLRPIQPMRYLHLFYLLFVLLSGGILGQKLLRDRAWRWLLLFAPLSAVMLYAQCQSFPGTEHFEWPGDASGNPWVEAFRWIQRNTPENALFALDPFYLSLPGEDYHGFRALAERSVLADMVKDRIVAAQVPQLAPVWEDQTNAQQGWAHFGKADFERLKARYGVSWVVLTNPASAREMNCPYRNREVLVCRVE